MTLKEIAENIGEIPPEETFRRFKEFKEENPNYMNSEEFRELQELKRGYYPTTTMQEEQRQ